MPNATAKTFEVPRSVLRDLKQQAISERKRAIDDPQGVKPLVADPTKADNQFGLRKEQIEKLKNTIIQGTGKNGR